MFPWQLTLFQSPPTWFQYVGDFQLAKHEMRLQTWANIYSYMLAGSCIWDIICKYQNKMPKVARNAFIIEEVWNPVCCHGNKTVSSYCGAHLIESYCKELNISDAYDGWDISYHTWSKFSWVYDVITGQVCIF